MHRNDTARNPAGRAASILSLLLLLSSSVPAFGSGLAETSPPQVEPAAGTELVAYAQTLSIREHDWGYRVGVRSAGPGSEEDLVYLLTRDPDAVTAAPSEQLVRIPVTRMASLSTTFLPPIVELGQISSLLAVDNLDFVYSPEIREAGAAGDIVAVGGGSAVDTESLVALEVGLVVANSFGGQFDPVAVLEGAGVPTLIATDWLETSPLGRAEWSLLFGALFDDMASARELFAGISTRYEALAATVAEADQGEGPGVLLNAPFQGTWFMAGGQSFTAQLVADAGGRYLFEDLPGTGGVPVDLETILSRGSAADIWINPGSADSLSALTGADPRFAELSPVLSRQVWNHTRRISPAGGNDYFESGALFADAVLADLIRIFRPGLLEAGEFTYYRRLQD